MSYPHYTMLSEIKQEKKNQCLTTLIQNKSDKRDLWPPFMQKENR
jgi:hypothetical protein